MTQLPSGFLELHPPGWERTPRGREDLADYRLAEQAPIVPGVADLIASQRHLLVDGAQLLVTYHDRPGAEAKAEFPWWKLPTTHGSWCSTVTWTAVYCYFSQAGGLLYVGMTHRRSERMEEHAGSPFAPFASLFYYTYVSSRVAAALREWALVERFRPPFNRSDGPDWRNMERAHLTTPDGDMVEPYRQFIRAQFEHKGLFHEFGVHSASQQCWHCVSQSNLSRMLRNESVLPSFHPHLSKYMCPAFRADGGVTDERPDRANSTFLNLLLGRFYCSF